MRPLRVFLCHASQDKPAVRKLHRYLKQHGIEPWLDEIDLLPGENWEVEIPRALNASDVILVCLSKNSVNKEGYVQKEISFALDKALEKPESTIFIIPAKLEDCDVPKRLSRFQWVDLFRPDSNKRLLLGLNKRALSLGSDVTPVKLEDTRQRKPAVTKSVNSDQLDYEALEKDWHEAQKRMDSLIADQVDMERQDREAKERSERETAEKIAREKAEREAREKIEREAAEKIARENLNNVIAEEIIQEDEQRRVEEKLANEKAVRKTANLRRFGIGGIVLFAFIFVVLGLNSLLNTPPTNSSTPTTPSISGTPKPLISTSIPVTTTPQPTDTLTPTPTLGIGSTMVGEKGETLVYVPAGEFTMGDGASNAPVHTVYLDAFWIDQTEVTNKQYKACVDAGTCELPSDTRSYTHPNYYGNPEFDDYPVIYVTWDKANRYCEVWTGGDLPTEAQWEKTARGTDARIYPWGNDEPNDNLLNYNKNVGDTTVVKHYPNTGSFYGTFDMAGNVWEWVNDWYGETYYQDSTSSNNPVGPESGQYRVFRGGAWRDQSYVVQSALRFRFIPSDAYLNIGFRCVRLPSRAIHE